MSARRETSAETAARFLALRKGLTPERQTTRRTKRPSETTTPEPKAKDLIRLTVSRGVLQEIHERLHDALSGAEWTNVTVRAESAVTKALFREPARRRARP